MANHISRNPLDAGGQKTLMAPKVVPSNSIFQMMATDSMRSDPGQ